MNLLLINQDDLITTNRARISGRRLQHMLNVHRVKIGDTLKAGLLNGAMGKAVVTSLNNSVAEVVLDLCETPPKPLPLTLILALPRPKMLRRIMQAATSMGVKNFYLINSYRVEKSYWQSPLLTSNALRESLTLGLEQGCDTQLPKVHLRKYFKPFAEDELSQLVAGKVALIAHPTVKTRCPTDIRTPSILAVGPEGGFIPYEVNKLQDCGFDAVTLGARILRVETAIPALLARLYP